MPKNAASETLLPRIISIIFHPLLMPVWAYVVLVTFGDPLQHEQESLWVFIYGLYVLAITFLFPAIIFYIMLRMKLISALHMPHRAERHLPVLITAVFFYLLFHLSRSWEIDPVFSLYMLGATMLSLMALLVNYWWKISLHTMGVGAITAGVATLALYFSPDYFVILPIVVLVSGLTASARLQLDAHTESEVYAGFLLGFVTIFTLFGVMMG